MKWRAEKLPIIGDKKTIKRFAFIPTRLSNDIVIWFEFYKIDLLYFQYTNSIWGPYWQVKQKYQ